MKWDWKTLAIGRHLVDVPGTAKVIPQWRHNEVQIELADEIRTDAEYDKMVDDRERVLRASKHNKHGTLFVQRVQHANRGVTLVSWREPFSKYVYLFDTFYRAGGQTVIYSGEVTVDLRDSAIAVCDELSQSWREIVPGTIPERPGFVARNTILENTAFNHESWTLAIRLAGKPDVALRIATYARSVDRPGLRERSGGLLASLLGSIAGMHQLRNHARDVGPIAADEILVAGTEAGKRHYAFKWEAPGKAYKLGDPHINVSMNVTESDYTTNETSFADDAEALELWDRLVDSIRLRPGAVGPRE
ncbi:T6SS immunity protein Tli4 family protein [Cupriavidus sp. SZY C1]|uniref:T6SS immunity protein Tli4 family protein n=1 Tax=Cupriavidus sp. SZY C1 TaxID=3055037 RepID=UPI0028B91EA4|nr:T6SS immunity protein Tli4 family protein [Cupriavidus sp. SZY C1]MDT6963454.1 T6SS immunity protein Tli4 family protein [Cupriavidus sp. SZY C1]